MKKVSVEMSIPSHYQETDSTLYRFKRRLTLKPILKIIKNIVKENQTFSLLEIGPGAGFLMTFLEAEFPNAHLTGIEYDQRLVPIIQGKVKNAKIIQGNAEEFNLENEKFDLIVSLQVIEHLYHPELMLSAVKKHLKPGGSFIFTTPNPEGLGARLMKEKWHGYRDDHVSLKGVDEWKSAVLKCGLTPVYCGTTFFTGLPIMNKLPLGLINWGLLFSFGSLKWKHGEAFVGIFKNE
jgi:SAM-dependent methyltransferase